MNCSTLVAGKAHQAWSNAAPDLMVPLEHLLLCSRFGGVGLFRSCILGETSERCFCALILICLFIIILKSGSF